jgi:hypothetical protein
MTVPLDRLYHFIENITEEILGDRVIIYRFWPHGSKNIADLNSLRNDFWEDRIKNPAIWCHDQEPLDYDYYSKHLRECSNMPWVDVLKSIDMWSTPTNLHSHGNNCFDQNILLHSEKRSPDLEKYYQNNELMPVYYWTHALLALDWYRYAQHNTFHKQATKTFLIYNRAWSGSREYRLKFMDLLIDHDLVADCQTSFNPVDPESNTHYTTYEFKNVCWTPKNSAEEWFSSTTAGAASSADFVTEDYENTNIEVVLETLFDDSRLHLTEKILRPVACGQPFILAGTHGSLEHLREYGFQTFADIWDESYDLEPDPEIRLQKIAQLMRDIANWDAKTQHKKLQEAQQIAKHNQRWFFSAEFFNCVVNELRTNLKIAVAELNSSDRHQSWLDRWSKMLSYPEVVEFLQNNQDLNYPTQHSVDRLIRLIQLRV